MVLVAVADEMFPVAVVCEDWDVVQTGSCLDWEVWSLHWYPLDSWDWFHNTLYTLTFYYKITVQISFV